jgi:anti-sigma regulatory factor (Ser/Thr protein kinase)
LSASRDGRPADAGTPGIFTRSYPGRLDQVRCARAFLRDILDGCPAADDAILCLGEIAGNAVQHSASGSPGGQFTVRVEVGDPGYVCIAVADAGGPWKEPPCDNERGRGLEIVRALASRFEIDGDESGRVVSFRCEWH